MLAGGVGDGIPGQEATTGAEARLIFWDFTRR